MIIADIEQIHALRVIAEHRLEEAKTAANTLRIAHILASLGEHFPHHTLAIFERSLDADHASLLQILGDQTAVSDLADLRSADALSTLTPEQQSTVELVNRTIRLIGSDDDLLAFMAEGDEEHEGWVEFQLAFDGRDTLDADPTPDDQEHA